MLLRQLAQEPGLHGRLVHWRLSPEDGGGVAVDLPEEVVDVSRRRELVVPVETQVAVAPVQ